MTAVRFLLVSALLTASPARGDDGTAFFESRVRPLLIKHCYECHSEQAKKVRGGLRLDTREAVRKGGDSGPVLVPGKPADSLLLKAVRHVDDVPAMPPKTKLSEQEIRDLEAWVRLGAPDPRTAIASSTARAGPEFWSFRPVTMPAVPEVRERDWSRNDVDRFILAKLEAKKLRPAPDAEARVLLRRVTFDLIGLPPTPEEVEAFLADRTPGAYERLVDRLLASPAYGERWGRHWLDVVRYADTAGDNSDYPIPQHHLYRDWVVRALNADRPYDQFVRDQLAGDLAEPRDRDGVIATGYLANTRRFGSYEDTRYPWYLTYEDTIDNLGRAFLGLTINCCRCHDHKFDPLTSEDYYALYGFFQSTRYPWPGIELDKAPRDLVPLALPDEVERYEGQRRGKIAALDAKIKETEEARKVVEKALKAAGEAPEAERRERIAAEEKRLERATAALRAAKKEREDFGRAAPPYEVAYAVTEAKPTAKKKVGNACIQLKGDPDRLGKEVPRRFPSVLGGRELPKGAAGSGRLELAKWLTDPANPLTGRVMANRVWHHHFGRGIVPTPSDFGKLGLPPSHPELLDYLASRLVADGWSLKHLHRLVVLSRTYQMASREDADEEVLDPENALLRHFPRRRLDAESLRDALLATGGGLDRSPSGPHPFPPTSAWDYTQHKPFKAVYPSNRRSIYLMTQRIQRHPFLALFDGPDTNASTAKRTTSTTSLQALYLMNDPFVHEQAARLAARLLAERSTDAPRLERAYGYLFGRPPSAEEYAAGLDYLTQVRAKVGDDARAWASLARALFLSNEFVYVE